VPNNQPSNRQTMKADAKRSAGTALKADPDIADEAIAEAKAKKRDNESSVQPVYKTQTDDIAGENKHRDTDQVISEFDDPNGNTI